MPAFVDLLSSAPFAVLAGSAITVAGAVNTTHITGDVGSDPTPTFTGQGNAVITGTVHLADAVSLAAQNDLTTAYVFAAAQATTSTIPTELGGSTLGPGVYDSAAGTFGITGTLILDGGGDPDAVFVFKMASTLITASASNVVLINGAQACNVFWQVGSSATLGTTSRLLGSILALTSITLTTNASISGRALARNGAVTLDTNSIILCNLSSSTDMANIASSLLGQIPCLPCLSVRELQALELEIWASAIGLPLPANLTALLNASASLKGIGDKKRYLSELSILHTRFLPTASFQEMVQAANCAGHCADPAAIRSATILAKAIYFNGGGL